MNTGSRAPAGDARTSVRASSAVASSIRRRIVRGELQRGDVLPAEMELAAEFGVSRPTLREALRILEAESLLATRRGSHSGPVVQAPGVAMVASYVGLVLEFQKATVDDVYAAVCELEPQCVRRLADFHTDADLAALGEALKSESRAGSPEGLWECQDQFHRLLVIRAGNGAIEVLIESLRHVIDLANRKYLREVADRPDVREEAASRSREAHRAVVKLIEQRRAAEAEELWRQHILDTGRRLKESGAMHSVLDLLDGS